MNILIAEDDPISLRLLKTTLEQLGHEVTTAKNGVEAWSMFLEDPKAIVISDWMMPEVDGLELCRKIRGADRTDYTYFIMLTARTGRENEIEAMQTGVDDFLTKPLNKDELVSRLRVAERILGYTNQIRKLQNRMLTICMYTKQIKVGPDKWVPVEKFFHDLLGVDFSHGISPPAFQQLISEGQVSPIAPTPAPHQEEE